MAAPAPVSTASRTIRSEEKRKIGSGLTTISASAPELIRQRVPGGVAESRTACTAAPSPSEGGVGRGISGGATIRRLSLRKRRPTRRSSGDGSIG